MSLKSVAALIIAILFSSSVLGAECAGVTYPEKDQEGGVELILNGLGLREATMFKVDVYVAALYVPSKSSLGDTIITAEGPKKLILKFVRGVSKDDISGAWSESFEKVAGDNLEKLKTRITKLNSWMADMNVGSTLTFIFSNSDSNSQVRVELNGANKGQILGVDFAKSLLSIWLGPDPPNEGLKIGLQGGKGG